MSKPTPEQLLATRVREILVRYDVDETELLKDLTKLVVTIQDDAQAAGYESGLDAAYYASQE